MSNLIKLPTLLVGLLLLINLQGCTVFAVADAAASTVVGVGKLAVKGTVAVVDAAIPDGDDDEEESENQNREDD